jgi:hypothetical protein
MLQDRVRERSICLNVAFSYVDLAAREIMRRFDFCVLYPRCVIVSMGRALRPLSYIERHASFEVRLRGVLTSVTRRARMRPRRSTYVILA